MKNLKLRSLSTLSAICLLLGTAFIFRDNLSSGYESDSNEAFCIENLNFNNSHAYIANDFTIADYQKQFGSTNNSETEDSNIKISKANAAPGNINTEIKIKKVNYYNNGVVRDKTISDFRELRNFVVSNLEVMNDSISFKYTGSETNKRVKEELTDIVTLNNTGKPVDTIKVSIYSNGKFDVKIDYTSTREIQAKVDGIVDSWLEKNIKADMNDYSKIKLIHDFIVANSEYTYGTNNMNNGYSIYDTSSIVLASGGVCNAYADLFQIMATKAGINSQKVIGNATNSTQSGSHAWNIVTINGKSYHIDSTWDDVLGFKGGQVIYDYFLKNDAEMAKSHSWDTRRFPAAIENYNTGLKHQIYNINMSVMAIK